MQDIRNFDRQKRGTWGQGALYDAFGGTISKALIDRVLDERRKAKGKRRKTGRSVEFVSPGITYSTDFIYVSPRGRVLKTQDERARLVLGFKHQDHWPDADAAAFQAEIFKAHGAPSGIARVAVAGLSKPVGGAEAWVAESSQPAYCARLCRPVRERK